jgi:hypothetical protein
MKHKYLTFKFKKSTKKSHKSKRCSVIIKRLFAEHAHSESFQEHELEFVGILDMVEGLEYHYKKFIRMENSQHIRMENSQHKRLKKIFEEMMIFPAPPQNTIHEIVAYFNRLGQIDFLFRSTWFKKYVAESDLAILCPTILALLPFRNKFGAHRSIDATRGESASQQASHASLPFGLTWMGKADRDTYLKHDVSAMNIGYQIKIAKNHRDSKLEAQKIPAVDEIEIFGKEEIWITFIPAKHHDKICAEIIKIVKQALKET